MTPWAFGIKEVEIWDAHHKSASLDDTALRAHAAFDPAKLGDLASTTAGMVQAFSIAPAYATAIARAAFFAVPAYGAQFKQGENAPQYRDYGRLVAAMAADASLGSSSIGWTAVNRMRRRALRPRPQAAGRAGWMHSRKRREGSLQRSPLRPRAFGRGDRGSWSGPP